MIPAVQAVAAAAGGAGAVDYGAVVLADAPLAYWALDEAAASNAAVDSSGHGYDGSGGGEAVAGLIAPGGNARLFEAAVANDVRLPTITAFTGLKTALPITIEFWIQLQALTATSWLYNNEGYGGSYGGVSVIMQTGQVRVRVGDGSGNSSANRNDLYSADAKDVLSDLGTHHLVAVYHAIGDYDLYIDGSAMTDLAAAGSAVSIGYSGSNYGHICDHNFRGDDIILDEVVQYDYELGAGRIAAHYAAGS